MFRYEYKDPVTGRIERGVLWDYPFADSAPACARNGWSVYPQDKDDLRRPSYVDDQRIQWSKYREVGPTEQEVSRWHEAAKSNVAVILGRASGNVFAVDIDVLDKDLADAIEALADEILGINDWVRVGNAPKRAMLYRVETADQIPAWERRVFANADGTPSEHMIEILGQGRSITAIGHHYKTENRFQWRFGSGPSAFRPVDVPVTTPEKLREFLDAVGERLRPFHKPSISRGDILFGTERFEGSILVPRLTLEYPKGADGRIIDGREGYLFNLCRLVVLRNAAASQTNEGIAEIRARIEAEFLETASTAGGWGQMTLRAEILRKTRSLRAAVKEGRLRPMNRGWFPKSEAVAPKNILPAEFYDAQAALRWLGTPSKTKTSMLAVATGFNPRSTAIPVSPEAESERVSRETDEALEARLRSLLWHTGDGEAPAHLLVVPTGGGKTSRTIAMLKRLAPEFRLDFPGQGMGLVFAVPSHANAGEALSRVQEDGLVDEAEAAGLGVMVFKGKLQPGMCQVPDKVRALSEAGIGTGGLCRAEVIDVSVKRQPGKKRSKRVIECPFLADGTCAYWKQVTRLQDETDPIDVLVVPHAYLGLGDRIPKPISEYARAVVVDENLAGTVLHGVSMPIRTLKLHRREPRLTKAEREAEMDAAEYLADRQAACEIAIRAIREDRDPAADFLMEEHGLGLIEAAITVTGRSERIEASVTPLSTLTGVQKTCSRLMGSYIRQENRFWKLIKERFLALQLDTLAPTAGNAVKVAKGSTDARVRRLRRRVRMAWLSAPALQHLPTMHMDATAEERIVRKIVGRAVDVKRVEATIRQLTVLAPIATFSKSSLLAREDDMPGTVVSKAKMVAEIRRAAAAICAHHGDGLVVAVCPKALEDHLTGLGKWPSNLRWMHYGATRGLDFAKHAVAMMTIGDLNARLDDYDDLVAALTWDDEIPEAPMVGPDGSQPGYSTVQEVVPLRDGRAVVLDVNRLAGEMAATLQRSIRDHELLQAWGRLRPVHRLVPGVVYHLGRTVPAGTLVDAVVRLSDLTRSLGALGEAIMDYNGSLEVEDVQEIGDAAVDRQFAATVAALDADPFLHPGLAVVRDGSGRTAILSRAAYPETREILARQGYDLSTVPGPAARERTEADVARDEAQFARRTAAWEAIAEHEALVAASMSVDEKGLWWLPEGLGWGFDRKGKPIVPTPMTMREALEAVRLRPLAADDETADDREDEMLGFATEPAVDGMKEAA